MSQHAIEGLIEDTVYLLDNADLPATDKRDYFRQLYRIQAFFDTGYTHFRVIGILLKYHFLYRIPVEHHPDYSQRRLYFQRLEAPGWLPDNEKDGAVYLQEEEGRRWLYFDAGDPFWRRLCALGILSESDCRMPYDVGLPDLIRTILEEAAIQGKQELLRDWYGLMVRSYIERIFDEKEGFPSTFGELAVHETLLAIRNIAQQQAVRRHGHVDEDLMLPSLREETALANDVDSEYAARFFLALKQSTDSLQKAYEKAIREVEKAKEKAERSKAEGRSLLYDLAATRVGGWLAEKGWQYVEQPGEDILLWYRDVPAGRQVTWLQVDIQEKLLRCQQGMQHPLLLAWQKRAPGTEIHLLHFYQNVQVSLPDSWIDGNKHLHFMGGWKFDVSQSKKTLEGRIDNLVAALDLVGDHYFDYITAQFPVRFFERDPEHLLHLITEGDDETGMIPDYALFDSPYSVLFAFAIHEAQKGNKERVAWCIEQVAAVFAERPVKSPYIIQYVEPFLAEWEITGAETTLPPLYHFELHRYLAATTS
ncbi:hypothetical protein [Parapedobacter lycopersici]|uniref:hypothetical protein n=1 Tax=Parapedobacter lycopersici TaxID=1864939 RepID=UPI00214DA782|nr:hypothetical protein [Parapedobacter lycopersici]